MSEFNQDSFVCFTVGDSTIVVGDLVNEPAVYRVGSDITGRCHLPATAIETAASGEPGAFAVDGGYFLLASPRVYSELVSVASDGHFVATPKRAELERERLGEDFGVVIAGQVDSLEFSGDGVYRLDLTQIVSDRSRSRGETVDPSSREVLLKALRTMNTLVCTTCFQNESQEHPELGKAPRDAPSKKRWVAAMAEHAIHQGWRGTPEPSALGAYSICCPKCRRGD